MKRPLRILLFCAVLLSAVPILLPIGSDATGHRTDAPIPSDPVQAAAAAQGTVIGTIEATFDGEPRTWYVLEAVLDGEQQSGAIWFERDSMEEAMVMVTGYDSPDVPFETFVVDREASSIDYGDYQGGVLSLTFSFQPGSSEARAFSLPGDNGAAVIYMDDLSEGMTVAHLFNLAEGAMNVTNLEASRTGPSRFTGTFSGTLMKMDQSAQVELVDGRFEITGARYQDAPGG